MDKIGVAILGKKRDDSADKASSLKIYLNLRPDGTPDFSQASQLVWMNGFDGLKALLEGKKDMVAVYRSPPFERGKVGVPRPAEVPAGTS